MSERELLQKISWIERQLEILRSFDVPESVIGRRLTMRPTLVAGRVSGTSTPTAVIYGAHAGYSMPIWSTPANQYEELYFREYIAGRWDGASDITISLLVCLASAETAGEDFAFQLSWESVPIGTALTNSTTNVTVQTELVDASQYATYRLDFTIDWDVNVHDIAASDHFACRIRRVAATGGGVDEVDGEVIVLDCIITYTVNKIFKLS